MSTILSRDTDPNNTFSLSLNTESRLIAISVAVALGILIFITLASLYLRPALYALWRTTITLGPIRNFVDSPESTSSMVSPPAARMNVPYTLSHPLGVFGPSPQSLDSKVFPGFFTSRVRRHESVSHRPTRLYTGFCPQNLRNAPALPLPSFYPGGPYGHYSQPLPIVTPQIAGWMMVADDVVGRHPQATPLRNRVATPEEVDLISGHVHIPWAFAEITEPRPVALKLQGPRPLATPVGSSSVRFKSRQSGINHPGFFKEIGNVSKETSSESFSTFFSRVGVKAEGTPKKRRKANSKSNAQVAGKENIDLQGGPLIVKERRGRNVVATTTVRS